jgi:X-X-X-Leu-X-X-Gly heptad repeat protein
MEGAVNATTDNFSTLIMETASHGVESLSDGIKELEDGSAELDSWAFKEDVETVMVIKFTMPLNWLVSQDVPETKNGLTVGVNASLDTI